MLIRDWSLIRGRGATKWEGGQVKFYPFEKEGGKSFNHTHWGEGRQMFPPFKRGGGHNKFYPVFTGGGGQKVSDLRFSHFVAPLPIINDQFLMPIF